MLSGVGALLSELGRGVLELELLEVEDESTLPAASTASSASGMILREGKFPSLATFCSSAIGSSLHFEDHFQLNRSAEWKTCDAVHQSAGVLVFSEDFLQQF